MSYLRPATLSDGMKVMANLRDEDKREVEGYGFPLLQVPFGLLYSEHAMCLDDLDGQPGAVGGVVRLEDNVGQIWMVCTPSIITHPKHFIKHGKEWFSAIEKDYTMLWNLADARNHAHHRLLKHFGFRALRGVQVGPNNLVYLEIVKLCA